jgi:tRNA(adenine34) deaminase
MASDRDVAFMALALADARRAEAWGDVPIGAVIVRGDEVLSRAGNARERDHDPTAHAELLAVRDAARALASWRLDGCEIFVTLEPCAMCAGALVLARIERLVYATPDPKAGFAGSLGDLVRDPRLNHALEVESGVLEVECAELLRAFFRARRSGV